MKDNILRSDLQTIAERETFLENSSFTPAAAVANVCMSITLIVLLQSKSLIVVKESITLILVLQSVGKMTVFNSFNNSDSFYYRIFPCSMVVSKQMLLYKVLLCFKASVHLVCNC